MSKDKCCGNCKHFKDEDTEGWGNCEFSQITRCDDKCVYHRFINNGWNEITPDNVDELYSKPVAVAWKYEGKSYYRLIGDCMRSPSAMAMKGGFYYYVLPELKIE